MEQQWQSVQRILAIRFGECGEVLLISPALHAIKTALPRAELTLLTNESGAQVARLNPDLDNIMIYQTSCSPCQKDQQEDQLVSLLKKKQFGAAIIFTSAGQSALPFARLCARAAIPLRLAACEKPDPLLTTCYKPPEQCMHEVERYLNLLTAIGIEASFTELMMSVPEESWAYCIDLLTAHNVDIRRPLIIVHPGSSIPARLYPWEMYALAINYIVEQHQAAIVFTGSTDEKDAIEHIIQRVYPAYRQRMLSLAGILPFPTLCALINMSDLLITNHNEPMHIAAAVKTPVVALFALTDYQQVWHPWHVPHRLLSHEVPCHYCHTRVCPYSQECLRLIPPEMVAEAVSELLTETGICRENQLNGKSIPTWIE